MAFNVQIEGLERAVKRFDTMPRKLKGLINAELEDAARDMEARAKRSAPADQGLLRNGISSYKEKDLNYVTVSSASYSAFVEWGTRSKVRVPAGLESYAAQFKGRGDAMDAKKAIYEWCRRKGIDPKLWYPIYVSLMVRGISPQPFFFIHIPAVKSSMMRNMKQIVPKL